MDSKDYEYSFSEPNQGVASILQTFENGMSMKKSISLEHDLYHVPTLAIPHVLNLVLKNGYAIKTISECRGLTAYSEYMWSVISKSPMQTTSININSTVNLTVSISVPPVTNTFSSILSTSATVMTVTSSITPTSTYITNTPSSAVNADNDRYKMNYILYGFLILFILIIQ